MKKFLAVLCCSLVFSMPAMADRNNSSGQHYENLPSNVEMCTNHPELCTDTAKTHAKKHSDTTKIVVISVATAAVFAGAMWYIFKKEPSENNPGQVKLAEF